MASIQKRGARWRAVIRRTGIPTQVQYFKTQVDAKAWARKTEAQIDSREFVDHRSFKGSCREVLAEYLSKVTPTKKGRTPETVRLNKLMRAPWTLKRPVDVRPADIRAWKEAQTVSGPTLRREMGLINSVFNFAVKEWNYPIPNPMRGVSMPGDSKARDRRPSTAELGAIRGHFAGKKMGAVVEIAILTAMRRGEIASLSWEQINLEERYIHLLKTKNGEERKVPLSRAAGDILVQYGTVARMTGMKTVFGLSARTISLYWTDAMKALQIEDLRFHDLRHEATTQLARKLSNVLELAAVTGHKDLKMLKRYFNPSPLELAVKLD